jgi:HlyD family secretion protein
MKVILGVLLGTIVGGLALMHFQEGGSNRRPKFRTSPVVRGNLFVGVTATGMIEPVESIDVGAQIAGCVKSFGPDADRPGKMIDYRSRVKAGDLLAQLDDLPYKAEVDRAKVNLQLIEAELKRAQAQEKKADLAYKRAVELRETEAAAELEKAEAENDIANAERVMADAKVEQAKIAKQLADINLGYTSIRSPIDGVVIDRCVNIGQTLVAGTNVPKLFLLAKNLDRLLVNAAVNEADIGDVRVGQNVVFTVDAYRGQNFSGKVSQIRLDASRQQNVVMYPVDVEVDNADGKLLPYMTANLQFEVARMQNIVKVPNQALRWKPTWAQVSPVARCKLTPPHNVDAAKGPPDDGAGDDIEAKVECESPTVWKIADDGLVRPISVEAGRSDGLETEILSGMVSPGDALVTGVVREAEPDFVSSFVTRLTEGKK